jgi:hypothetical protein
MQPIAGAIAAIPTNLFLFLGILAIGLVLALGLEALMRRNGFRFGERDGEPVSLVEAAELAYETARRDGLPLAHVAEQSGGAVAWFRENILKIVRVIGGKADAGGGSREIKVSRKELNRYLRWLRGVQ